MHYGNNYNFARFLYPVITNSAPVQVQTPGTEVTGQDKASLQPAKEEARPFILDSAKPLLPDSFPNPPANGRPLSTTIPNVQYLLKKYGITVKYNVIQKKLLTLLPGQSGTFENADNVALTQILSLAALNGLPSTLIPSCVEVIGDRDQYNPAAGWIKGKPWDQKDRLEEFYATLVERDGYPRELKRILMKRWLLSTVAAALMPSGFHGRGVLTLQGPQSIGKTSWIKGLISDQMLSSTLIKLDHHLDASNKDSMLTALGHWIVEIGELDSSFKKDIARLKGFLTAPNDKLRRPYARGDSEYQRRTVFCASVNDSKFLVDSTGNSRWWTIAVSKVNFNHGIDMQQLFAQLAIDFENNEPWWLTQEEEKILEQQNNTHRVVNAIQEQLHDAIDIERADEEGLPAMTATEVLQKIGLLRPTNPQCRDCGAFLRMHLGESKRIKGYDKWRVPLRVGDSFERLSINGHSATSLHNRNEDDF